VIVIATHPGERSKWLERGDLTRAREWFAVPITYVEVDSVEPTGTRREHRIGDRHVPPREHHARRRLVILITSIVIVGIGSLETGVLFAIGLRGGCSEDGLSSSSSSTSASRSARSSRRGPWFNDGHVQTG
jgi:hypothetical protein